MAKGDYPAKYIQNTMLFFTFIMNEASQKYRDKWS